MYIRKMNYLPSDLWMIIIQYQTYMGDYNPAIFNKQYQMVLKKYNKKWNSQNEITLMKLK